MASVLQMNSAKAGAGVAFLLFCALLPSLFYGKAFSSISPAGMPGSAGWKPALLAGCDARMRDYRFDGLRNCTMRTCTMMAA